ncbi:hypothetical protein JZ751_002234 [Albula glossodonta]|uniref:Uncharacterized protein n=1 Tax=Albula glossodonta TaxID=121402 RepID=A0A8T2PG83_9TELE|nr:hypothetical protein JZ751_002234 [Albula glossodonta]
METGQEAQLLNMVMRAPEGLEHGPQGIGSAHFKRTNQCVAVLWAIAEEHAIIKAVTSAVASNIIDPSKTRHFYTIFHEIFPSAHCHPYCQQGREEEEQAVLKAAVMEEMQEAGLQLSPCMLSNALSLYQALKLSQAVILVGLAGSGKKTCRQTLARALRRLAAQELANRSNSVPFTSGKGTAAETTHPALAWSSVDTTVIFPNSLSIKELWGGCYAQQNSWWDGALTKVLRERLESSTLDSSTEFPFSYHLQKKGKKVGKIQKEKWLVLDGDPLGCPGWMDPLCTLCNPVDPFLCLPTGEKLHLPCEELKILIEATDLQDASPSVVTHCSIVHHCVEDLWRAIWKAELEALHREPCLDQWVLKGTPHTLQKLSSDRYPPSAQQELEAQNIFMAAYVWGFGGHLHPRHRPQFEECARDVLYRSRYRVEVPAGRSVFEHFTQMNDKPIGGLHCRTKNRLQSRSLQMTYITIPQYERYAALLRLMLKSRQPVLVVGESGSGKTTLCRAALGSKLPYLRLPFSSQLRAADLRHLLEGVGCQTERSDTMITSKKQPGLRLFVDDLHEAPCDVFGKEAMALETLRHCVSECGVLTPSGCRFKLFKSGVLSFLATCGIPGEGRSSSIVVSPRLSRLFSILVLPCLSVDLVFSMHLPKLQVWMNELPTDMGDMADCIIEATLALYHTVCKAFPPCPEKPHFLFSLHDLQKVFQGICMSWPSISGTSPCLQALSSSVAATVLTVARLWMHECLRTFGDRLCSEEEGRVFVSLLAGVSKRSFGSKLQCFEPQLGKEREEPGSSGPIQDKVIGQQMKNENQSPSCDQGEGEEERMSSREQYTVSSLELEDEDLTEKDELWEISDKGRSSDSSILDSMSDEAPLSEIPTEEPEKENLNLAQSHNPNHISTYQEQDLGVLMQQLAATMNLKVEERDGNDFYSSHARYGVHRQGVRQLAHILRALRMPSGHGCLFGTVKGTGRKTTVRLGAQLMGYRMLEVHSGNERAIWERLKEASINAGVQGGGLVLLVHDNTSQVFREELVVAMANRSIPGLYSYKKWKRVTQKLNNLAKGSQGHGEDGYGTEKYFRQIPWNTHVFLLLPLASGNSWHVQLQQEVDDRQNACEHARQHCLLEENRLAHLEEQLQEAHQQSQDALQQLDLDELRRYRRPPEGVTAVMDIICILFKRPCSWECCQQLLGQPNFLQALSKAVREPGFQPEAVRGASQACESLCRWAHAVYQYAIAARCLAPLEARRRELEERTAESRARLREGRLQEEDTQACLEEAQTQLQGICHTTEELENRLREAETQESNAATTVQQAAPLMAKWKATAQEIEVNNGTIPGDALLLAAAIAYLGPFEPDVRSELLEKWRNLCLTGGININPEDPRSVLLSAPPSPTPLASPYIPIPLGQDLQVPMTWLVDGVQGGVQGTVKGMAPWLLLKLLLWGHRNPRAQHCPLLVNSQLRQEMRTMLSSEVQVVDLSLSVVELQEVMLAEIVQSGCPKLWSQNCQTKTDRQMLLDGLHQQEESLMDYIIHSSTPLLQDPHFLPYASACQSTISSLRVELLDLNQELKHFPTCLRNLAELATAFYQALQDVARLSPLYLFPLHPYLLALHEAMTLQEMPNIMCGGEMMTGVVSAEVLASHLLAHYRPSLFQDHALLLRLLVSVAMSQCSDGDHSLAERAAFLWGLGDNDFSPRLILSKPHPPATPPVLPSWVPLPAQQEVLRLERLPPFKGLVSSLTSCSWQWLEYLRYPSSTVVGQVPCPSHSHLSALQRTLLWKTLLPHWLAAVADDLAACQLGKPFQMQWAVSAVPPIGGAIAAEPLLRCAVLHSVLLQRQAYRHLGHQSLHYWTQEDLQALMEVQVQIASICDDPVGAMEYIAGHRDLLQDVEQRIQALSSSDDPLLLGLSAGLVGELVRMRSRTLHILLRESQTPRAQNLPTPLPHLLTEVQARMQALKDRLKQDEVRRLLPAPQTPLRCFLLQEWDGLVQEAASLRSGLQDTNVTSTLHTLSWLEGRAELLGAYLWKDSPETTPYIYRLSAFHNPRGFLAALLRDSAKTVLSAGKVPDSLPQSGAYLCGLELQGALWDTRLGALQDTLSHRPCALPVVWVRAQLRAPKSSNCSPPLYYCPLYLEEGFGEGSIIIHVPLAAKMDPVLCAMRRRRHPRAKRDFSERRRCDEEFCREGEDTENIPPPRH